MSFHLLRQLPAGKRASVCLRLSARRLYSAQPALQLRQSHDHEQPTSHETPVEHSPVEADAPRKRRSRTKKKSDEEHSASSGSQNRRNPLEPTRVDVYLASLQSEGVEPTLNDLEQRRPLSHPNKDSVRYVKKYNELVDVLCRSFSKAQLHGFVEQSGLHHHWKRRTRRKVDFAEVIIEGRWGWPSLEEVQRARRDKTEIVSESTFCNQFSARVGT